MNCVRVIAVDVIIVITTTTTISLFFKKKVFTYLTVLGLHCCAWAYSIYGKWGLLFIEVRKLLIVVAAFCYGAQVK